jgi:hypothetical protein
MGTLLLSDPWVDLYLLYVTVLFIAVVWPGQGNSRGREDRWCSRAYGQGSCRPRTPAGGSPPSGSLGRRRVALPVTRRRLFCRARRVGKS